MTEARATVEAGRGAPRGRIDKRQAILSAAFTVFARQGYTDACVQEIAAEAGVAKPTVYNHLNDKANLFRQAVLIAADEATARNLAAVEGLLLSCDDLHDALVSVAQALLLCHRSEQSWALRRLLYSEVARFPDLLDTVQGRGVDRVTEAMADRLARLTLSGRLTATDPVCAAEQFMALLAGPMEARSRCGTRQVPDAELNGIARAAVDTFLKAFGREPGAPGSGA
ncbi:TetR/AcrR family transcriptional regulator [Kitasatospora sp. NPDC048286]|uniref:TetR/AcrR family transcriptional regulator n=1 Tax=Kitasatospora sp. NPDC048286 TaxID=3364047 RepID=UPI00371B4DC7